MKMFKKSTMSLALTAALIGGVAVTQQATANTDVTPGVAAPGDPYVSNNALGQALIFPYYTVRGGKKSIINIFNTSARTVVAKVRFHESHNSRDVLDFNLVLSPFDKWSGTLELGGNGGAIFKTRDNSCTVPMIPATGVALNAIAYNDGTLTSGYRDADADQTIDRTNEGYVEVIAMGDATIGDQGDSYGGYTPANPGNVAYNSTHVNGVPRNCAAVETAFTVDTGNNALGAQGAAIAGPGDFSVKPAGQMNVAGGNGSPMAASEFDGFGTVRPEVAAKYSDNPLRGALTIVDEANGVGFGISALAIGDFTGAVTLGATPAVGGTAQLANTANLVTAQELPYFLEPTIASRDNIWTTSGLGEVEFAMNANVVINEWANNPANGASTDWVLQYPTKGFHVDIPYATTTTLDCRDDNVQAARNKWRGNLVAGVSPACHTSGAGQLTSIEPFAARFTDIGSAVGIEAVTYDKEERKGTPSGISFSPAQPSSASTVPWESNVITFGGTSVLNSSNAELILDPVNTISGSESNGMAILTMTAAAGPAGTEVNAGLPVIGFVAKERDQGGTSNYGQIMTHSFQ